jgi:hypothetical protein
MNDEPEQPAITVFPDTEDGTVVLEISAEDYRFVASLTAREAHGLIEILQNSIHCLQITSSYSTRPEVLH